MTTLTFAQAVTQAQQQGATAFQQLGPGLYRLFRCLAEAHAVGHTLLFADYYGGWTLDSWHVWGPVRSGSPADTEPIAELAAETTPTRLAPLMVPRVLLDAVLAAAWEQAEKLDAFFNPFGNCPQCRCGLWPVDEGQPTGTCRCENCGTVVSPAAERDG